jgi:Cupin domain
MWGVSCRPWSGRRTQTAVPQWSSIAHGRENEPPPHVHLWENEIYYVLEGKIEFHCEDQVETVGPGETIFLPKGKAPAFYLQSEYLWTLMPLQRVWACRRLEMPVSKSATWKSQPDLMRYSASPYNPMPMRSWLSQDCQICQHHLRSQECFWLTRISSRRCLSLNMISARHRRLFTTLALCRHRRLLCPKPDWWNDLDGSRRIVVVTQGTVANYDFGQLLEPTLEALADRDDFLVLATTGGRPIESVQTRVPENARIAKFLPFDALLPKADLLIPMADTVPFRSRYRLGYPSSRRA